MMIVLHALFIAMMLSGGAIFGMEHNESFSELYGPKHEELKCIIKEEYSMFEQIAPRIRALAQNDKKWKEIVDTECHTERLLYTINRNLENYARFKNGFDLCVRNEGCYIYLELAAAILGTPGAIKFGTEFIKQDSAKERLKNFLFTIVEYGGSRQGSCEYCLSWPDEDVDVVKAGLEMGLDPHMLSNAGLFGCAKGKPLLITAAQANKVKVVELLLDRGVDKDVRFKYESETRITSYTALHAAAIHGCNEVVDLLVERKADINAVDNFGRTPLIWAIVYRRVEMVKKLLSAKAIVWLLDGYDETALNYAEKSLLDANLPLYKENYRTIVQLLKDAGA
jgi:hypothetical protein